MALLDVRDLKIAFYDTTPPTEVVKGISFSLEEGETLIHRGDEFQPMVPDGEAFRRAAAERGVEL